VVDLTTILMGPLASRMLADHGADVIRIDPPTASQDLVGGASGLSAIALDTHRNKRSITLDLKSAEGAAAMRDLIASADVLVTNMRAAALERLGLDAKRLRAGHPELIHCVANGYGADGPYADRAAYDDAIQAISGLAALPTRISAHPSG
jgi:crotonobetainyl-CoA:carnitine CoA-transferase CaiB-like acyl-CoA transferase